LATSNAEVSRKSIVLTILEYWSNAFMVIGFRCPSAIPLAIDGDNAL
jgi:hypothetical protein